MSIESPGFVEMRCITAASWGDGSSCAERIEAGVDTVQRERGSFIWALLVEAGEILVFVQVFDGNSYDDRPIDVVFSPERSPT